MRGFAAKLSWAATKKKPSENEANGKHKQNLILTDACNRLGVCLQFCLTCETGDICRGVAALKDSCGVFRREF